LPRLPFWSFPWSTCIAPVALPRTNMFCFHGRIAARNCVLLQIGSSPNFTHFVRG
jgi:hypothetical protein